MELELRAALIDWLASDPALAPHLNAVVEESPARVSPPWLGIAASASADWSAKDRTGREVRVALELHYRADQADGGAALIAAIERRVESLPRHQPGFEAVTVQFARARVERRADQRRAALIEYRFRLLAP